MTPNVVLWTLYSQVHMCTCTHEHTETQSVASPTISLKSQLQDGSAPGQYTSCDVWFLAHGPQIETCTSHKASSQIPYFLPSAPSCLPGFLRTEGDPRTRELSSLKLVRTQRSEESQPHWERPGAGTIASSCISFLALPTKPVSPTAIMERPQSSVAASGLFLRLHPLCCLS